MKRNETVAKIILTLSIISILILWPITFLSLNDSIWFLIQKNDVALPEEEIKMYNHQVVSFFKDKTNDLSFITQEEISHMRDVKDLVTKANLLFFISLILFLPTFLYLKKVQFIKFGLKKTSFFILFLLILSLVVNILGFNSFFLKFHEMFFVSNYIFPSTSMLKILYPDNFFRDIFTIYFILAVTGCLVVLLTSYKLKV